MLTNLLSACPSWFQPKTKVIEYDEEVKLHDGSMIWVHIKRHYGLVGGAIGDPGWRESTYMPGVVEISWDTGFPNVGRKSVFFDNLSVFDKFDNKWYLFGGIENGYQKFIDNSINVSSIGTKVGSTAYLVILNENGEFLQTHNNELSKLTQTNILNPINIKDWGYVPEPLNGKRLTWVYKIELQNQQPKQYQFIHNEFNMEKVK